ncbi:C-C motif chemokine 20 [Toxotes jaculatrix]|uniref:C-C motif chemokine 20 n=1 Tax=Toxotes jaculatrix TaxID=941984 RepID=UPI001B3AF894|nr:C-C motif chemokine 20 [Toxotes jaculatrix]
MDKQAVCVSLLLVLLVALSESSPTKVCCTQYHEPRVPVRLLRYYTVQEITDFCNIRAIVFRTMKNKLLCANPQSEWVQYAMGFVPEKR